MVFRKIAPVWRCCDAPPQPSADDSAWTQFWQDSPWNPRMCGAQPGAKFSTAKRWVHLHFSVQLNVYAAVVQPPADPVPATAAETEFALQEVASQLQEDPALQVQLNGGRVLAGEVAICTHMDIDPGHDSSVMMHNLWPSNAAAIMFRHPRDHADCKSQRRAMLMQEQMLRRLMEDTAMQAASRLALWPKLAGTNVALQDRSKEIWYNLIQSELHHNSIWSQQFSMQAAAGGSPASREA